MIPDQKVSEADLVNWRALVRRVARNCAEIAAEMPTDDTATKQEWTRQATELRRLGDWLDGLTGLTMGEAVNGHGRTFG